MEVDEKYKINSGGAWTCFSLPTSVGRPLDQNTDGRGFDFHVRLILYLESKYLSTMLGAVRVLHVFHHFIIIIIVVSIVIIVAVVTIIIDIIFNFFVIIRLLGFLIKNSLLFLWGKLKVYIYFL